MGNPINDEEFQIPENRAQESLRGVGPVKIDRMSGAFEEHFSINDKAGLVHYGHCLPAKPLL
jgi:hypothetical protein